MDHFPAAIEFYCGIGGASIALNQAGYQIERAIDIDRTALDVYRQNFPRHTPWMADAKTSQLSTCLPRWFAHIA